MRWLYRRPAFVQSYAKRLHIHPPDGNVGSTGFIFINKNIYSRYLAQNDPFLSKRALNGKYIHFRMLCPGK